MVIFCIIQDILLGESRGFLHVEGNKVFGVAPIDENPFQVFKSSGEHVIPCDDHSISKGLGVNYGCLRSKGMEGVEVE